MQDLEGIRNFSIKEQCVDLLRLSDDQIERIIEDRKKVFNY